MKNVTLIGILAAVTFLTGCRSPISKVRNGYLEYNKTITVGQALEHTFSNGTWKSFTTDKGVTIVEFDGSHPFKEARGMWGNPDSEECSNNLICSALAKKINDYCDSAVGQAKYLKDYQDQRDNLKAKIAALSQQEDTLYSQGVHDGKYAELSQEEMQLWTQLEGLSNPENSCFENAYEQNADDPIPVVVQFSINSDGTFQYYANDMSWSTEKLFYNMYK